MRRLLLLTKIIRLGIVFFREDEMIKQKIFNPFLIGLLFLSLFAFSSAAAQEDWKVIIDSEPGKSSPAGPADPKTKTGPSAPLEDIPLLTALSVRAVPDKARAGELVTFTIVPPGSIAGKVGRIDVICPDGIFTASPAESGFKAFWQVPDNLEGDFHIQCKAYPKQADPYGQIDAIASGSAKIKLVKITLAFSTEKSSYVLKEPGRFKAVVKGGTPPYACQWFLGGPEKKGTVEQLDENAYVSNAVVNWEKPGTFRVGVVFSDANDFSVSHSILISVSVFDIEMTVSATKVAPETPITVTLRAIGTDEPLTFCVDPGDGRGILRQSGGQAMQATFKVTYKKPGKYQLTGNALAEPNIDVGRIVSIKVMECGCKDNETQCGNWCCKTKNFP